MSGQTGDCEKKRATFGMGCFWAGDSLFGATPGVLRTTVGYSGGTKYSPTYKNMGDHTEVTDIDYDPSIISFEKLLNLFWKYHEYGLTTKIKTQYASLILYHDDEQKLLAEKSRDHLQNKTKEKLTTTIKSFERFYPAEDYHQKYRLQSHPCLLKAIGPKTSENLQTSTLAAKLNGYIAGASTLEDFQRDTLIEERLNEEQYHYLKDCLIKNQASGLYC